MAIASTAINTFLKIKIFWYYFIVFDINIILFFHRNICIIIAKFIKKWNAFFVKK